jgi:ABC-type sugar transport system permease subunit
MKRHLLPAAVAVLLTGSLVACGGGGGKAQSKADEARGAIKVWLSNNKEEVAWGEAMVAAWNAGHANEQVTAEQIPAGRTSEEVITAAITAGPHPSWLVNRTLAMPLIALFVTWKQLGFFVLLYLAALQSVPRELYETAAVDGASRLRTFLSVTVPGVRPATTLVVILATVTGANLFTEPYLLTGGGGPDGASVSPVLVIYQRGIQQGEPDFAAALGVLLMILVLGVSLINRRLIERE